jgi:hypothetical protein
MIIFSTQPFISLNLNNIPSSINKIKVIYPFLGHFWIWILLNFAYILNVAVLNCFQNSGIPLYFLRPIEYL